MKREPSLSSRVILGAVWGAVIAVVGLLALMFIAGGVSAGVFTLMMEHVFGYLFGKYWLAVILLIGAAVGAVIGARGG